MNNKDVKYIVNIIKAMINEDGTDRFMKEVDDADSLMQVATSVIPYGDVDELCETMNISDDWFDKNWEYDEAIEDYSFIG